MGDLTVVVGAQFGSEGKGALVGYLAKGLDETDFVIRVAGPNAGHTAYDSQGREWKLRAVPVAAVTNDVVQLHIAAGSEVDLAVLMDEIAKLETAGIPVRDRLTVHPSATILDPHHISQEREAGLVGRVGSTGKGIGAARAARIMRRAATFGEAAYGGAQSAAFFGPMVGTPGPFPITDDMNVIIEGTQGYGLGLHTEFYPQVTSSDCRAVDFLAMAGISPWDQRIDELKILLVARTYPIRVAGNSGPLRDETSWAELGLPEERTTVTNNTRRVGQWDQSLVEAAIEANGGGVWSPHVELALTMLDQLYPEQRDEDTLFPASLKFVEELERSLKTHISYVGTGPNTVVEL